MRTLSQRNQLATIKRNARALIASNSHKGNHGFKDAKLKAWRAQRKAFLSALRMIAEGRRLTWTQYNSPKSLRCPRLMYPIGAGQASGERWVSAAGSLLYNWYWFHQQGLGK